jgi:hypothetical protein
MICLFRFGNFRSGGYLFSEFENEVSFYVFTSESNEATVAGNLPESAIHCVSMIFMTVS